MREYIDASLEMDEMADDLQESSFYQLDLTGVKDRQQLHAALSEALDMPDWYGENLDALYDILTSIRARIDIYGWEDTKKALNGYFQSFERVCADAMEENPELLIRFL